MVQTGERGFRLRRRNCIRRPGGGGEIIPTLGVSLAYGEVRRFASPSPRGRVRTGCERGPRVCSSCGGGQDSESQLGVSETRRPRQVSAARGGGVARRVRHWGPEVRAATS